MKLYLLKSKMGEGLFFVLSIFSVKISRAGIFNQMQKEDISKLIREII
jgi:hypothetical protein